MSGVIRARGETDAGKEHDGTGGLATLEDDLPFDVRDVPNEGKNLHLEGRVLHRHASKEWEAPEGLSLNKAVDLFA